MLECTALCVSSLHRTPLARYPAIRQQPACPFAREFDHRRTQRSGTCPSPGPSLAYARSPFARATVLVVALLIAGTGIFTVPPTPARAASTEWFGQKGSFVDGSGAGTAGTFLAAGSSLAGDAQFTYDIPVVGNNGESGTWSFFTTAGANGTVPVPYHWTGLHAWFNVTARLDAVVVRGASLVSTTNLVNAGPESCCTTPSNGFDYAGTTSFTVQTGDKYGFVLRGSNGDFNDFLRGDLTIGTVVPTSCANAQTLYGSFGDTDGRYVIHPSGGQRFTVHCADMAIPAGGKDYLEVRSGPGVNYGQYAAGGAASGTTRHDLVHEGSARSGQPDGGRERHAVRDEHAAA